MCRSNKPDLLQPYIDNEFKAWFKEADVAMLDFLSRVHKIWRFMIRHISRKRFQTTQNVYDKFLKP